MVVEACKQILKQGIHRPPLKLTEALPGPVADRASPCLQHRDGSWMAASLTQDLAGAAQFSIRSCVCDKAPANSREKHAKNKITRFYAVLRIFTYFYCFLRIFTDFLRIFTYFYVLLRIIVHHACFEILPPKMWSGLSKSGHRLVRHPPRALLTCVSRVSILFSPSPLDFLGMCLHSAYYSRSHCSGALLHPTSFVLVYSVVLKPGPTPCKIA